MIKITSTNDVIIVEGDELTRHYPYNGTLVIPKNSTLVLLDESSEMVLFKSASNYDTLFTGILGSIYIEDEIVTRDNIIEKFNAISNVIVGGNVGLFEVVQSLPTENISDNKVYLVLDSNGSEGNTYVEYLYVNGQWEELGKFKVNVDLSGYATEDWVNSQGFLKEHQDISNLATKEELNTKQDTINDLDTIRSGASKGATALQSVPSEYALKTDILSAKTDTRYTTFDVQNPVLSGNTIVLQNEVTDSRKYHTFGYEKTITASVPVQKYINIERNYNGKPSMDTNIESGISFDYNEEYDVGHMYGDIPFTLDKINAVTNLLHYEVSYADNSGETIVDDVIYDPNTKLLSVSDGRFSLAQIRKSDNGQHIFGGNTDGNEYLENGRWYYNFEQHPLQEGVHLIFEPYYSSNLFWNFSLTLNGIFYQESSVTTDDKPNLLNDYIRYSNNVKAYILTDKNTTFKTINGEQITGNGNITIDTNVDLSSYATEQWVNEQGFLKEHQDISNLATKEELNAKQDVITDLETIRSGAAKGATALQSVPDTYALKSEIPDITTKQDTLVSGTNIKTVNGTSLLGSGNIVIEASADNVPTVQTSVQGTTNNYIYSSGQNDKYGVISDFYTDIVYTSDKASIHTDWYYWGNTDKYMVDGSAGWSIEGATTSQAGLMSASDKTKLDGIDLSTKQDTLVSGTNIKTVNGNSLLGSGDITIEGGSGNVDLSDYYTKQQTNALVNPKLSQVTLTQAEYDALSTKEENVLYIISDASTTDSSDYYTKSEIDEMIGGASTTITQINDLVG